MTAKELIYHLNNADATPRKYSGRGMYGKYCVGCTAKDAASAFLLGMGVGMNAIDFQDLDGVCCDSMGMGVILYWPKMVWPADEVAEDDED